MTTDAASSPKKTATKKVAKKRTTAGAAHPAYETLVKEAIKATQKPVKGASRQAIEKYIREKYGKVLGARLGTQLKLALKRLTVKGKLVHTKGSYRVSATERDASKKKAAAAKKRAPPRRPRR